MAGDGGLVSESSPVDRVTEPAPDPALLQLIWNSLDSAIAVYDRHGRRLAANPAALRVLDRVAVPSGRRVIYFADGVTVCPEQQWPLWRALGGENVRGEEYVLTDADAPAPGATATAAESGARRVNVSAYPIAGPDGPVALVAFHDTTDGWASERSNSTALAELNQLLDGAADYAILLLDPAGAIRTWSSSARRLTGFSEQEVLGQDLGVLFPEAARQRRLPEQILERAAREGRCETEGERLRRDGSCFTGHGVVTAMRDGAGRITAFVKVTHDVSRQRAAENDVIRLNAELRRLNDELEQRVEERTRTLQLRSAELAAANAELESFSYSVSHDLRAPLRAVQGFARLLREQLGGGLEPESASCLDRIEAAARQMGKLIDALLELSRTQRQDLHPGVVDMGQLVQECWAAVTGAEEERTSVLRLDPLPAVHGDPMLLRQVWINLLGNAVKYTGPDRPAAVEISGRALGGLAEFRVRDHGVGFDVRFADKLFQAFQRLHRDEDFPGLGIGLAIVEQIVRRHGGSIRGEPAPGGGALFSFTVPVAPGRTVHAREDR